MLAYITGMSICRHYPSEGVVVDLIYEKDALYKLL